MSGLSTRKDTPAFFAGFFQTSSAKSEVRCLGQGTVNVHRENIGMERNISEGRLRQLRAGGGNQRQGLAIVPKK